MSIYRSWQMSNISLLQQAATQVETFEISRLSTYDARDKLKARKRLNS